MDNNETHNKKKEHFVNDIKVSDEVAQKILDVPIYAANDQTKLELYQDFVSSQKDGFKAIMYYFNDMITELKKEGKISDYVEFRARIKAPSSALKNDSINLFLEDDAKFKALDDVFAIEFISATEKEVKYILSKVNKVAIATKRRNHNKKNGYKAKHRTFILREPIQEEVSNKFNVDKSSFPIFEAQFKTIEVAISSITGKAAHVKYKGVDYKTIQSMYNKHEFVLGYNIPQMWVSTNGKMIQLSSDETLKKLYPFLDITKKEKLR